MRSRVLLLLVLLFLTGTAAGRGGLTLNAPNPDTQINIGANELGQGNLINAFKAATVTATTLSDNSLFDANGYLVGTLSGNVSISWPSAGNAPQAFIGVQYRLNWPNDVRFQITFNSAMSACTSVQATVSGCTGSGTTTITSTAGQAGSVTFTNGSGQLSAFFVAGAIFAHTNGELALYRVSDETAYQAGQIWTNEFLTAVSNGKFGTIRTMGLTDVGSANFNGDVQWKYRITPHDFSWRWGKVPPGAYGGAIAGTDTYTASAAPDTPVAWTDGEVFVGTITNTNTITAPTLNIASRGAKIIVGDDGLALTIGGSGSIQANKLATFVYDGVLDEVVYHSSGIQSGVPVESHVSLANAVNANLWAVVPYMAQDSYVTSWATAVCSSLNSNLYFYPEYANEVWNNSFPQTNWAYQRGLAFGFPNANNEPSHGYYGIRVAKIMGTLVPAACTSRMTKVRRTLMFQGGGNFSQTSTYRLQGSDLAPVAQGGQGNSAYNSFTSSANYRTFPNRPVDVVESIGYAPYVTGSNFCSGPDVLCTITIEQAPYFQCLVNAVEGLSTSSCATTNPLVSNLTPVNLIDDDVRQGRTLIQNVTASGTTFTTPSAHGFTAGATDVTFQVVGGTTYSGLSISAYYRVDTTPTSTTFTIQPYVNGAPSGVQVNAGTGGSGTTSVGSSSGRSIAKAIAKWYALWEPLAVAFDASRPPGMAVLRMEWYEGNLEPQGPTSANCTTMGITGVTAAQCATDISNALLAWKTSYSAYTTQQYYLNQFFGIGTHSKAGSNLILDCAPSYELIPNCAPATASPYQTYYGMRDFH